MYNNIHIHITHVYILTEIISTDTYLRMTCDIHSIQRLIQYS